MTYLWRSILPTIAICISGYGQATQAPATPDELNYFRFILLHLGELNSPSAVATYEAQLARNFALNAQEVAVIDAAARDMASTLGQIRTSLNTITAGKTSLLPSDNAAAAQLSAQREQKIASLANQILNSVRPEAATRLREPGHIVAKGLTRSLGGK
jgi:hypothetical protein